MHHIFLVFLWSAMSALSFAIALLASPIFQGGI